MIHIFGYMFQCCHDLSMRINNLRFTHTLYKCINCNKIKQTIILETNKILSLHTERRIIRDMNLKLTWIPWSVSQVNPCNNIWTTVIIDRT